MTREVLIKINYFFILSTDFINENPEDQDKNDFSPENEKFSIPFAIIGGILLFCGCVNNISMLLLPNLGYFDYHDVMNCIFTPMTTGSLSFLIGGLLAIKVASHAGVMKKFTLFLISLGE